MKLSINPLVPDAHYSERQDKPFSLQIPQLEVDFKVKLPIFIFCTLGTNGLSTITKNSGWWREAFGPSLKNESPQSPQF